MRSGHRRRLRQLPDKDKYWCWTRSSECDTQFDSLRAGGITRIFAEKISTRATVWPELDKAVHFAQEIRASGAAVTIVVHEHKRLGRGLELAALAEQLKASDVGLEFLTGKLQGSHDPSAIVFIRDRTLEGQESACTQGKGIGGASVTDDHMLSMALHLRSREMSLRDIASQLVITKGKKKGQHPSPATILHLLRAHDETTHRSDGEHPTRPPETSQQSTR